MSKLDQPLKLKHGLAAAVAIMAVSITGTAIAGGGGGGGGGNIHYRQDGRQVDANSQASESRACHPGEKVIGGGVRSTAGFANGRGMMINTTEPYDSPGDPNGRPDDGWSADVDVFENAGDRRMVVYAICME